MKPTQSAFIDSILHFGGRARRALPLLALLVVGPSISHAQKIDPKNFDYGSIVSDLNAIAPVLEKSTLTNADVRFVGAIGCSTARVALRNRYAAEVGPFLRSTYPSAEQVSRVNIDDFMQAEDIVLQRLGATAPARTLVQNTIKAFPKLSLEAPAQTVSLNQGLLKLESNSCELRQLAAQAPAEPAPAAESKVARCIGKGVVGMAVIVTNAVGATLLIEMPIAAAILGAISGGWGWNRVEEGCF